MLYDMTQGARAAVAARLREALAQDPEVQLAYLFGSFAGPDRFEDLDLGVVSHSGAPLDPAHLGRLARFADVVAGLLAG